ncbi:MAG TPA: GNAT family N-acetyltransferase [Gemmatimonadaceae bacterium]|jgi:RimJ/RimL family protein N-acetyltransferase|nr:GNAT family N-acetyltransferase [Gemmatimonadaceae bacterium]
MAAAVPLEIRTQRLYLRPWRAADAEALHPILVANYEHLAPWIPPRVATPSVVPLLADRLAAFGTEFETDREWRFAMLTSDERTLLGEIDLFPRSAAGRVAFADADRAEIGYWLRADETGRGLATEAVRAIIDVARRTGRFAHLEIRCDARNEPSAAVPKRLGFSLATTIDEPSKSAEGAAVQLQVWTLDTR